MRWSKKRRPTLFIKKGVEALDQDERWFGIGLYLVFFFKSSPPLFGAYHYSYIGVKAREVALEVLARRPSLSLSLEI